MDSAFNVKLRSIENKYSRTVPVTFDQVVSGADKFSAERRAQSKASNLLNKIFKVVSSYEISKDSHRPTKPIFDPPDFISANLVVLDLETTGLDVKKEAIIQVGYVLKPSGSTAFEGGFQCYVDPNGVPNSAEDINKITPDKLVGARTMHDVWSERLMEVISGADMVIFHNRCFDFEMLSNNLARQGVAIGNFMWPPFFCTKEMAAKHLGRTSSETRLYKVADHYGYAAFDAHEAINDALATAFIFEQMIDKSKSVSELMNFCDMGL